MRVDLYSGIGVIKVRGIWMSRAIYDRYFKTYGVSEEGGDG